MGGRQHAPEPITHPAVWGLVGKPPLAPGRSPTSAQPASEAPTLFPESENFHSNYMLMAATAADLGGKSEPPAQTLLPVLLAGVHPTWSRGAEPAWGGRDPGPGPGSPGGKVAPAGGGATRAQVPGAGGKHPTQPRGIPRAHLVLSRHLRGTPPSAPQGRSPGSPACRSGRGPRLLLSKARAG